MEPVTGRQTTAAGAKGRAGGLDGLRALAVLAVMAFHEGIRAAPGGFLGVDVFFVLSGYLITDLLATQAGLAGRPDLRRFWIRRARRLLPALAVMLVAVTATVAVIEPAGLADLRPALAAAVTYSSNWYQALHHVSYFASFGPPPPLQHLWSLAIEEQFYLAWPLILWLVLARARGRVARSGAAWLAAAASAVAMAMVYRPGGDPSLVYYGTGTHAAGLLVGAALALTWPLRTLGVAQAGFARRADFGGIAGLVVLAWAAGHLSGADPALYPAGMVITALAAGAVTVAAATPGVVSALLGLPPLRWLGVRSYGIYLWHWPVIALAAAVTGPGPAPAWQWLAEAGLAIGLAAASWRWIETPILHNGFRAALRSSGRALAGGVSAARHSPARALPVLAVAAATAVACTAGYGVIHPTQGGGLLRQVAQGAKVSAATRAQVPGGAASTAPAAGLVPPAGSAGGDPGAAGGMPGPQVTAVGDSVMLASAPQLRAALPGIYIDAQVSRQMSAGLAAIQALAGRGRLRQVVVVGLGTNGAVTTGQIRQLLAEIGPSRELVLVNTYEARPWEHEVNTVIAAAASRYPNVVLANWQATIARHTGLLWDDGVHPRPPGARLYARVVSQAVVAAAAAASSPPVSPAPGPSPRLGHLR